MGNFFAKCIQDSRLVDIPLSRQFLKMMCMGDVVDNVSQSYREIIGPREGEDLTRSFCDEDRTPTEDMDKELILDPPKLKTSTSMMSNASISTMPWYAGLLTHEDFELVDPHRGRFLKQLRDLVNRKQAICNDSSLSEQEKNNQLQVLTLENPPARLEDLGYVNITRQWCHLETFSVALSCNFHCYFPTV